MPSEPTLITPATVRILCVESPSETTDDTGNVYICKVQYELHGQIKDAVYTLQAETGALRVSSLGHSADIYIGQLLGGLIARVEDKDPGVCHAQTH
jgi:hypothetical protein